jgi:heat-inducible transcriptional repressor
MLDDRKKKILQIIIEDYIATAEPVGSRTIARKYNLGISPATIRNEMSDLELLGFLEQPHTSAGRIPSAQAYRYYVDSMVKPGALAPNDMALIDSWYKERVRSIDDIFKSTAKILSRMSKNVSLVLAKGESSSSFSYMRFLPLNEHKAIACLITEDGQIDNAVVDIPLGMKQEELDYLAQRVSNLLHGIKLKDVSNQLLSELHDNIANDKLLVHFLIAGCTSDADRTE